MISVPCGTKDISSPKGLTNLIPTGKIKLHYLRRFSSMKSSKKNTPKKYSDRKFEFLTYPIAYLQMLYQTIIYKLYS